MKEAKCQKCQKFTFVEEHHILPTSTFGPNDEISDLCPNCHTEYHLKLGKKGLKNPSMEFHLNSFIRWVSGLAIAAVVVYLLF